VSFIDNMKLSVVIPGYKDPYHEKTVRDLLDNSGLGDQLEIISVFDGYWPSWELVEDPRRRIVHLGKNRGMRGAINAGVDVSRGEFFCRLDEHCCFAKGWDKELTDTCEPNQIMTARRYFLDPNKWEVMKELGYIDYERLNIQDCGKEGRKFSGQKWRSRDKARKDVMVDETQAMQGSMWIMPRAWWDKHIKELQTEGYGPAYQDSVEVSMKTWKQGGKLMLNKNTWFAHKHRNFSRTHNEGSKENPWIRPKSWKYALEQWEEYYNNELKKKWEKDFT